MKFWIMLTTSWHWDLEVTLKFDFGQQKSTMEYGHFIYHSLVRSYLVIVFDSIWFNTWHLKDQRFIQAVKYYSNSFKIHYWRENNLFLRIKLHKPFKGDNFITNIQFHYKRVKNQIIYKYYIIWHKVDFWSTVNFLVKQLTKVKLLNPKPYYTFSSSQDISLCASKVFKTSSYAMTC